MDAQFARLHGVFSDLRPKQNDPCVMAMPGRVGGLEHGTPEKDRHHDGKSPGHMKITALPYELSVQEFPSRWKQTVEGSSFHFRILTEYRPSGVLGQLHERRIWRLCALPAWIYG